jgi:hypothetical protein
MSILSSYNVVSVQLTKLYTSSTNLATARQSREQNTCISNHAVGETIVETFRKYTNLIHKFHFSKKKA